MRNEEGFIWITGRMKDMINSGSESIYTIAVEQLIAAMHDVTEIAVVSMPDEAWGEGVAPYVVLAADARLDADAIVEHCRRELASCMTPHHVIFGDGLPRNTTNKVSKGALRAQLAEAPRR